MYWGFDGIGIILSEKSVTNFSIMLSVTITVLDQMAALIQYYKYELVLTSAECSTFYGAKNPSVVIR